MAGALVASGPIRQPDLPRTAARRAREVVQAELGGGSAGFLRPAATGEGGGEGEGAGCWRLLPIVRYALLIGYHTQVRRRTAVPMSVSCSTADRSRWCAQLAPSQCHHYIEEWVSPLQVRFK